MRVFDGQTYRDATAAETAERAAQEAEERKRPLTVEEVTQMLITAQINTLAVDDATALRMLEYYPEWAEGTAYSAGSKVQRSGRLWRCVQAHTSLLGWEPENAAALWESIDETHSGTAADPIPYDGSMELDEGLYYSQGGVVYRCTRGTGQPVYNTLAELVGLYVEAVE